MDEVDQAMSRTLCWFSCGDASAVAAKFALSLYENVEVLYCDTFAYEHPDNKRFFNEVQTWLDTPIKILRSEKYTDIYDVFRKTKFLKGPNGARCTTELKKNVRRKYQTIDDVHIFGYTVEEGHRIERFRKENPDLQAKFPLFDHGITKTDCHRMIHNAGIELPTMYKLGFHNNNCIGCVKGGLGYFRAVREDFPEQFEELAAVQLAQVDAGFARALANGGRRQRQPQGVERGWRIYLRHDGDDH